MGTGLHASTIVAILLHAPLSAQLVDLLVCDSYNDLQVLTIAKDLTCAAEPLCLATAGVFLLTYTVGIPLTLAMVLREFFSPAARERLKGTATAKRAAKRFGFLVGKYEAAATPHVQAHLGQEPGLRLLAARPPAHVP